MGAFPPWPPRAHTCVNESLSPSTPDAGHTTHLLIFSLSEPVRGLSDLIVDCLSSEYPLVVPCVRDLGVHPRVEADA